MLQRLGEETTPQADFMPSREVEGLYRQADVELSLVVDISTPQVEVLLSLGVDVATQTMAAVQVLLLVNATILADLLIHLLQVAVYVQTELVQPL
jgi:hypothetical protein